MRHCRVAEEMTHHQYRAVLVLVAHPAMRRSRVNRRLMEAARGLDGVVVNDLYQLYPDFDIDVAREQQLLTDADVVVLQHPFYWYSTPAILKEWQDLVLEHGWAYGHDGHALENKLLMNAVSTGGPESAYSAGGSNHFTVRQLLAPIEQTAGLCRMRFLPPFVIHSTHALNGEGIEGHAEDYRRVLTGLRDGVVSPDRVVGLQRINADLDAVLGG